MGLIRLLLALAVLLSHAPTATVHFIGGGLAVQAFFIVSGFYMALVLDGKYASARLFYGNRIARLAPAYFVVLLIGLAMLPFGLTVTATPDLMQTTYANPATADLLTFANLAVVGQHLLYWFQIGAEGQLVFAPLAGTPTAEAPAAFQALVVPQSWSLSMELLFYALAPWLARRTTPVLVLLAAASIALRFAGLWLPVDYGLWQGRLFAPSLFLFLFGMLAYRTYPAILRLPRWSHALGALATVLAITALPLLPLPAWPGRWVIYLAIAAGTPFAFALTGRNPIDRWIGELSYPIYLTHLLVIAVVLTCEWPSPTWSVIALSVAVSALLLVLVERPVDRWRQRRVPLSGGDIAPPSP